MADYGVKIRKLGASGNVQSSATKDLIILSTAESHKVAFNGSLSDPTITFTHSLGYIPFFQAYYEDGSGDLFPLGYVDDQLYDTIYARVTTSLISLEKYIGGDLAVRHYTIYYEN